MIGNVSRQALDVDLAMNEVEHAPLLLHARWLPPDNDRDGDRELLVHRHAVEIRVQEMARDRDRADIPARARALAPPPLVFRLMSVFTPVSECRIRMQHLGIDRYRRLLPPLLPPYTTAGILPLALSRRASFLPRDDRGLASSTASIFSGPSLVVSH